MSSEMAGPRWARIHLHTHTDSTDSSTQCTGLYMQCAFMLNCAQVIARVCINFVLCTRVQQWSLLAVLVIMNSHTLVM